MYKIEKGVPMKGKGEGYIVWDFSAMDVGDSFFIDLGDVGCKRVYAAASRYGSRSGKKFVIRTIDGGVRCWRIK